MLSTYIKYLSPNISSKAIRVYSQVAGRGFLAHHGIQRSGTNYLNLCLSSLGLYPINLVDPERNDPKHKHFRWYEDKSSIPDCCNGYRNTLVAHDVYVLNMLAGYPPDCRHIVIKKPLKSWLVSIMNWGLRCGWFSDKQEAIHQVDVLKADYDSYYLFWSNLHAAHPNSVVIMGCDELVVQPMRLLDELRKLGLKPKNIGNYTGKFAVVPQSPPDRRKMVCHEDIEGVY